MVTEAYGQGHETGLLVPAIETIKSNLTEIGGTGALDPVQIVTDSGYHTENNMRYIFSESIDGYVADKHFRRKDPRFATQDRFKDLPGYYGSTWNGNKRLDLPILSSRMT